MPHIWNNIWVVTESELTPWYNKPKTLYKEIERYRDLPYGIKKVCSGGNGRQLLIAYDSLREEIKATLGDPRRPAHLLDRFYKIDHEAVSFYSSYLIDGFPLKSSLQEEYITNASVLRACVLLKSARETERRTKNISLKGVLSTICADAHSFQDTLKQKYHVQHTLPTSEKRFKEYLNEFVKPFEHNGHTYSYNYACLVSGKVRNQNNRKVNEDVLELLNNMFKQSHKPTRTEISRVYDGFLQGYVEVINEETGEVYDPKNFKPLSDETIVRYLGSWSERIATYTERSDSRMRMMGNFITPFSFKRPEYAGSIVSVDDRQPPFVYADNKRVWFYNAIDLGSEAFTTWVYGKTKEGIIQDFYRQMVRNYTEWGFCLPHQLEAELNLNAQYQKTFLRNGALFQDVHIFPNNARAKRIERYYGSLRYGDEKQREGWLARPHARSEANQPLKTVNKIITPYNTIVENSLRDIENWNNSPHSVYTDKTRWEVFTETQHPNLKPTNWHTILPSLGYCTKTSVNVGIIRLQNEEFLIGENGSICTGDRLIQILKKVQDRDVLVYWLDDNYNKVMKALVYLDDVCICEAVAKPKVQRASIERTPEDDAATDLMMRYIGTVKGYMSRKRSELSDVIVIDNRPKTLNRKFVMPGIKRYEAQETEPETLPDIETEDEAFETIPNTSFIKSTKDRI